MTHPARNWPLVAKLGCSAAVLLVLLGALELVLRARGYDPFGQMFAAAPRESREGLDLGLMRIVEDEVRVYELVPGAHGRAWDADIAVNDHGFRDRDYAPRKPPGSYRIVALGDSATFGVKLPVDALWPKALERSLAEGDRPVEVLNLGIVGYDVLEEVVLLEQRGLAFGPDLVVMAFHPNDIGHVSATRSYVHRLQSYGAWWYRIRLLQYVRAKLDEYQLGREFHLVNTDEYFEERNRGRIADLSGDPELLGLMEQLRRRLEATPELAKLQHRYVAWYTSPMRVGKLRHALERLKTTSEQNGFEAIVFVVPWLGDRRFEDVYDLIYAIVRHEVERAELEYVEMASHTRAAGHPGLVIERRDFGHPNAKGHRILAGELEKYLRTSGRVGE